MKYKRKTRDEYRILVHYGQVWEHEITEETFRDAREQYRCYRANCPYPVKIVKKRVRIEEA